ncbi:hypothetical protein BGX38DRAFT_1144070 [Terfezia claveryi]|nr:hypothetical protein BGX38DRAFT_1144070 [Terfezia claveryi]
MRDYLEDFHKYKEVFLRFRATKSSRAAATMASKDLRAEYHRLLASDELGPATPTKRRKLQEEQAQENKELVNDTLTSGAHYNFPKMHLISHFVDQIAKYGSLPQYSTRFVSCTVPLPSIIRPETDVARLMDAPLEAFITLQVSVLTFNNDGQMIHHLRCTGDIEGMAHLVPIKDEELYIVNNCIDLHTWNDIHDGN